VTADGGRAVVGERVVPLGSIAEPVDRLQVVQQDLPGEGGRRDEPEEVDVFVEQRLGAILPRLDRDGQIAVTVEDEAQDGVGDERRAPVESIVAWAGTATSRCQSRSFDGGIRKNHTRTVRNPESTTTAPRRSGRTAASTASEPSTKAPLSRSRAMGQGRFE